MYAGERSESKNVKEYVYVSIISLRSNTFTVHWWFEIGITGWQRKENETWMNTYSRNQLQLEQYLLMVMHNKVINELVNADVYQEYYQSKTDYYVKQQQQRQQLQQPTNDDCLQLPLDFQSLDFHHQKRSMLSVQPREIAWAHLNSAVVGTLFGVVLLLRRFSLSLTLTFFWQSVVNNVVANRSCSSFSLSLSLSLLFSLSLSVFLFHQSVTKSLLVVCQFLVR